jgi:hypothetical protein
MAKNVTLRDTNTPRIEQTYSGGPENVTVPGYGKTPDEGAKDWIPAYAGMTE